MNKKKERKSQAFPEMMKRVGAERWTAQPKFYQGLMPVTGTFPSTSNAPEAKISRFKTV
jgi:hypothetical protein